MSDDLVRAQDEITEQLRWGESRETKVLRLILRLLQGKSRGPYARIINGRPTWTPNDGEQVIDRANRRLYVGVDSQWLWTKLNTTKGS